MNNRQKFTLNLVLLETLSLIVSVAIFGGALFYKSEMSMMHLQQKISVLNRSFVRAASANDLLQLRSLLAAVMDNNIEGLRLTLNNAPNLVVSVGRIKPENYHGGRSFYSIHYGGAQIAYVEVFRSWSYVAGRTFIDCLPYLLVMNILVLVIAIVAQMPLASQTRRLKELLYLLSKYDASSEKRGELLLYSHRKADTNIKTIVAAIASVIEKERELSKKVCQDARFVSLGQSTAMVAHDVRKPLTSMKALLSVLPTIKDNPEELRKMMAGVDSSIARTNAMLNDVLEFSRDETSLTIEECDPQSIISSAISDILFTHAHSDIQIIYNLRHVHVLQVDSARIVRVLSNILDNAVHAMMNGSERAEGKIWIGTEDYVDNDKRFIRITIADSGHGMPDDVIGKVFDPFFTHGKKSGTGLGLAICQQVVKMHKGRIEAGNRLGAGAEFVIELPAGEGESLLNESELIHHSREMNVFRKENVARIDYGDTVNAQEFMKINKARGRKSCLLVADDEPLFRKSVRRLLGDLEQVRDHVKIVETDSAETGLMLFENREFDYVVTDIDLGKYNMNGYEFAREILENYSNAHVLIHSNKRKDELDKNIREIESDHFMGFLPKPMTQSELLQFLACKTFEVLPKSDRTARPKKNILVVNDDDALLISFKYMLETPDVNVLSAINVGDAVKRITDHKVDLILSDINLGKDEPSGYDLLKHVREREPELPFYFVSGYSVQEEGAKAKMYGATGYLQLPVDSDKMRELLN